MKIVKWLFLAIWGRVVLSFLIAFIGFPLSAMGLVIGDYITGVGFALGVANVLVAVLYPIVKGWIS